MTVLSEAILFHLLPLVKLTGPILYASGASCIYLPNLTFLLSFLVLAVTVRP